MPEKIMDSVHYQGEFPPDEVPNYLTSGFGLVWDGDFLETCSGITGNYLRYNNPHKLSLYLASDLPVIVWSKSAEAPYVKRNKIGITIDSLKDLDLIFEKITPEDYHVYVEHVSEISNKLRDGYYLKEAVRLSIDKITDQSKCI